MNKGTFDIELLESRLQNTHLEFDLNDDFFAAMEGLVQRGTIHTKIDCSCLGTRFKFNIHSEGIVIAPCDRCLADVELRIDTDDELFVQLGEEYDDDGECVTIPETEGRIDLAQFIYEFIALSMPITICHEPGNCDESMMQTLSMHQATRSGQEDDFEGIDSATDTDNSGVVDARWAKLKALSSNPDGD